MGSDAIENWLGSAQGIPGADVARAEDFESCFRPSLVSEFIARGMTRIPTLCYSPHVSPGMGGPWRVLENFTRSPVMVHLARVGATLLANKDAPPGTPIRTPRIKFE